MSNVVTDFHNFRNLYSSTDLFGLFGMCFSRYNFDRNIMYLDQSTLRHQGQNRAFEAGTCKKSRISISF